MAKSSGLPVLRLTVRPAKPTLRVTPSKSSVQKIPLSSIAKRGKKTAKKKHK